jgi:branched-chain amino acid transport system permease protein
MNWKKTIRSGLVIFAIMLYLDLIGFPLYFSELVIPLFGIITGVMSYAFTRQVKRKEPLNWIGVLLNGLLMGLIGAGGLVLVTYLVARLQVNGVRVTEVFAQLRIEHTTALVGIEKADLLAGANVFPGLLKLGGILVVSAVIGAALTLLMSGRVRNAIQSPAGQKARRGGILVLPFIIYTAFLVVRLDRVEILGSATQKSNLGLAFIFLFIGAALFALREVQEKRSKIILAILLGALVLYLPLLTNLIQNAVLGAVAIFIVMGIGLNIVVGFAGLLDLGYVAFFAVGAYSYALLSAPESYIVVNLPGFEGINFWIGIPIAVFLGALAGVLLGAPVLRMRGDYLAIVTLGFGEIIRLLVLNLRDYTGGPGGVLDIPSPIFFGIDLGNPRGILYLTMGFGLLATFITLRLHDSRLGRAWIAMREDEDVAEAMGINLVATKLLAFAAGAALAALAGTVYASRQVNIFPDNFDLAVSINVLSLIIIGGIGSIEGVVLGSIALIGLPEILRSVDEYRIIAFGALLVAMMILQPEGFLPSVHRKRELHGETENPGARVEV